LGAYRRRYVAQAAGFGNESASDRSEDEPHRGCHSIAEEQAEGEGEMIDPPEKLKTGGPIYWGMIGVGVFSPVWLACLRWRRGIDKLQTPKRS
jgi:hypothetical protein